MATRWTPAVGGAGDDGPRASSAGASSTHGARHTFEIEVWLPGVKGSDDIVAEVVTAGAQPYLSVLAMADEHSPGDGGEDAREDGTDFRADVPIPATCDATRIAKVKFSKKKCLLTVRFNQMATGDGAADDDASARAQSPVVANASSARGADPGSSGAAGDGTRDRDADHAWEEEEGDEDNPLAEYLSMLGMKTEMRRKLSAAAGEEGKEGPRAGAGREHEERAYVDAREKIDKIDKDEERKNGERKPQNGEQCPLCPPSEKVAVSHDPPVARIPSGAAASAAAAGRSARPSPAVLAAALAAASAPVTASNNSGVVVANGTHLGNGGGGGGGAKTGNKKKDKKNKKKKREQANTGQLAPLKCIRTARTIHAVSEMADDMATSLRTNGWAVADFITSAGGGVRLAHAVVSF